MFKNTIKLLASNFSIFWKVLLYKLIVIGIIAGLFCATLAWITKMPEFATLTNSTISFFGVATIAGGPTAIITALGALLESLYVFLIALATTYPAILVYVLVLIFFILPYLWHLSDLATNEGIFGYMSSQTKYGFTSSFIRRLNRSSAFSLAFTIMVLPFNLIFLGGIVGICLLSTLHPAWMIASVALLACWIIMYYAFRTTLLGCWSSAITASNCKTWTGFGKAIRAVLRSFARVLSNAVVIMFILALIFLLTSPFGSVILIPLYCFVMAVFGMVVFFEHQGMRYYVDFNTIVSPKKLELTDKVKKIKFII
ncbi:MAG: hypothetical protein IKB21_02895 [Clostridia bacterium]|nr:hypothetical protein [Clostridia bacterium]MBR2221325.1 hypothetical protein [Clostridia bacterium]MBR2433533.1 hypothetical protein [Clostridia bacterium]